MRASVIAVSGSYEKILSYVVALDAVFFGLTGASLLVFRRRERVRSEGSFRVMGHPWTTMIFAIAFWIVALNTIVHEPKSAGIGVLILLLGVPVYLFWRARGAAKG